MSVVIIGGHDRMVCQYKKICKSHKCKAKVFTQMSADLDKQFLRLAKKLQLLRPREEEP